MSGRWVSDPVRRQTVWVPSVPGGKPDYRRTGSGGTSPAPKTTPAPTYTSDVLQQTFSSRAAMESAETQYQKQQAQQRASELLKQESSKTPSFLKPTVQTQAGQFQSSRFEGGTVNLPSGTETREFSSGTKIDTGTKLNIPVYSPGTVYQVQTGVAGKDQWGREVPYIETYYVGEDWSSKLAPEYAKEFMTVEQAEKRTAIGKFYGETMGRATMLGEEEVGYSKEIEGFSKKFGKPGEIIGGVVSGFLPSTKKELVTTGIIFGASAGVGFAVKGLASGATIAGTRLLGTSAGTFAGAGIKLGAFGTGAYFTGTYAVSKAGQFMAAPDYFTKSKILGETGREVGVGFAGFKLGSKGYDIAEGWARTRGRTLIDIPTGDYPTAPTSKQLKMFQENIYKELGSKPGAFHTTGQTFWKSGKITPEAGTSELPGLYGSTLVSTPFARITGSGSGTRWIPRFSDIMSPSTKPGVAYLKPEGFRYSPYMRTGKGYDWAKPPKPGYADVPLLKTEIEAIFRPGAGTYALETAGYYTKIKGVKVPLDVFGYAPDVPTTTGLPPPSTKIFSSSSYRTYVPPPVLDPTAGIVLSYSSKVMPSYSGKITYTPSSAPSMISSTAPSSTFRPKGYSSSFASSSKLPSYSGLSSMKSFAPSSSMKSSATSDLIIPIATSRKDFGFDLPKFKLFEKAKRRKGKREFLRRPSLVAAEFDIKALKPVKGEFTGLVARPLL